jgi:hypothetical protein
MGLPGAGKMALAMTLVPFVLDEATARISATGAAARCRRRGREAAGRLRLAGEPIPPLRGSRQGLSV